MYPTEPIALPLSKSNALYLITAVGFAAHLAFNRLEPRELTLLLTLLIIIPGILSTTLLPHFSHWIFAIVTSFLNYYLVLGFSLVAYRLSPFHPLARYPGRTLDKVSMLWVTLRARRGKRFIYVQELHQKYGDVIRIGPNEISICDPSVIAPLHGTQGLPKGPQNEGRKLKSAIPSLIAIVDRKLHMQRRTHWLRGLNPAALKDYEPIINNRVTQLVEQLQTRSGSTVDLSQRFSYFAYDFMMDMAFGGGTEMMRDGDVHNLWKLQDEGICSLALFGRIPWVTPFASLFKFLMGGVSKFRSFGMEVVEKRRQAGAQRKDLFYHLFDEGGVDKEPPSLEQVLSDGSLAIAAGSDTTATVLSNLLYFLMSNRWAYASLQAEVDKFYPADEDSLSTEHHANMPYLTACIDETLRLLPVVPGGSQRACYKGMGPRMLGSYYIPEGTAVSTNFYAIQRDPRNFFPAPEMFWPERWLINGKKELAASSSPSSVPSGAAITRPKDFVHNPDAFAPFSYGPANCVGKFLALQEMKTVICHMMQKLDVRFAEGYDPKRWIADLEEHAVMRKGNLPVMFSTRV